MSRVQLSLAMLALSLLALLAVACGNEDQKAEATASSGAAAASAPVLSDADLKEALRVRLASADLADGTEDKTVSKCAGCRLGMSGNADHASEYEGYTLHLCSSGCKAHFEKDSVQVVMALPVN